MEKEIQTKNLKKDLKKTLITIIIIIVILTILYFLNLKSDFLIKFSDFIIK